MTFQTTSPRKKEEKSIKDNFLPMQNGTVKSSPLLKPFKGTKSYLEELDKTSNTIKTSKKRKADFNDEVYLIQEKKSKYDPFKVMSKLEQFSDVWNDCPHVENPKNDFEIVSNNKNEEKTINKRKKIEKITAKEPLDNEPRPKDKEKFEWPNKCVKVQYFTGNSIQENNDYNHNSHGNKSQVGMIKNTVYKTKEQISENKLNLHGKYDPKLAEMKRKKAVQEQSKLYVDQKNIIKSALSSMDSKQQVNKKIVFSDGEDNEELQTEVNLEGDQMKNRKLFEDDDFGDDNFELKINRQFEGKKGQKVV